MALSIERIEWGGWHDCVRVANGEVELVLTGSIGPRIMRYGFAGGQNLLKVYPDQAGKSGEPAWQLRGGHRIWLAPEDRKLTYAHDNSPAELTITDDCVTGTSPVEPDTGLRKRVTVKMAQTGTRVDVIQGIQNTLPFPVQYATWSVTMFPEGGVGATGFPPRRSHEEMLQPSNPLVMWAFTDLRDKRWTFLEKYLLLRQDPQQSAPTKLGHFNRETWGAYFLNGEMFLKTYEAVKPGIYPDMGCSFEAFTRAEMLELETLGPVSEVAPGAWLEHTEHWSLHRGIAVSEWTDDALDCIISPRLLPNRTPV